MTLQRAETHRTSSLLATLVSCYFSLTGQKSALWDLLTQLNTSVHGLQTQAKAYQN
jgi:hypothetical protein